MRVPTEEQIAEYSRKLDAVIEARDAGEPSENLERDLKAYMVKTGIADEPPVTDFPELAEQGNP